LGKEQNRSRDFFEEQGLDREVKVENFHCEKCNKVTPHTEDVVFDKESATVWHCLICGEEKRPKGGNAFVPA
jgi:RNase P subunit RPR2